MEETFSVHDTSKDPEAFYHGFMVGATASLYHNENYEIKSNRESGYGRYDYMIFSHDITKPTILIEIKRIKMAEKLSANDLDKLLVQAAQQALVQIQKLNYLSEARQRGRTNILKIGLAFSGKHFQIRSERECSVSSERHIIHLTSRRSKMKQGQFPAVLPLASLDGKNGFKIDGETAQDLAARTSEVGDINGDGYVDIAIEAINYSMQKLVECMWCTEGLP